MFDYIYQKEDCRCQFFKMPMSLFTDELLAALSNEAKLLYGLLLDRTGLSLMNDWADEDGRVYINFTNAEVCRMLKIGAAKTVKIFKELVAIGLIERIRIGLGKPDRIFVKHIVQPEEQHDDMPEFEPENVTFDTDHSAIRILKFRNFPMQISLNIITRRTDSEQSNPIHLRMGRERKEFHRSLSLCTGSRSRRTSNMTGSRSVMLTMRKSAARKRNSMRWWSL